MKTHGMSSFPEYMVWLTMRKRCNDPKNISYGRYGAKGIKVDARWDNFAAFIKDVGRRPTDKHQLDRIDNRAGYSPGNVRWVLPRTNARNGSSTKLNVFMVRVIKGMLSRGASQRAISRIFCVDNSTISLISNGKLWADIETEAKSNEFALDSEQDSRLAADSGGDVAVAEKEE